MSERQAGGPGKGASSHAIRIERVEGDYRLLSAQVKNSVDILTSTLQSLQADSRNIVRRMDELARLQHEHDSNKVSIDEMKKSIALLSERLSEWFEDFDKRNQRRWEQYETNRDQWRKDHEAKNSSSERELGKEIRDVRETVIRFMGYGAAVSALAGLIAGGFLWNLNYRFNDVTIDTKDDYARVESSVRANRARIDSISAEHGKELNDIKLYLARGGRIPEDPYIPQSQRKNNETDQRADGEPRE